jgi:hypothetical protein
VSGLYDLDDDWREEDDEDRETWLRNRAFVQACTGTSAGTGETWIAWAQARDFERRAGASESERAILRIAVALGSDEYRLSRMDDGQAEAIVKAFAAALAVGAGRG